MHNRLDVTKRGEASMTDETQAPRRNDSALGRQYAEDMPWPLRAAIMAAVCAVGALLFYWLIDFPSDYQNGKAVISSQWGVVDGKLTPFRQALAVFVAIAMVSFAVTVELRRWWWAVAFAVGWGAVTACVGFFTARYSYAGEVIDFPFFAAIFAVLLAAPLFQTARDLGQRAFPYARAHNHIWTDAVIGAAALGFTGISFLLINLLAELFKLVGLDFLRELLNEGWFGWLVAGLAFGTAIGVLRERDALVSTLQRLVMIVLSVLAPVLAIGLVVFLLSLPFTGLDRLWETTSATTPILLGCAAGAFILANAVIGNGIDDRSENRILRGAALALALCILPLAIIAAISMGLRIGQYGWTPARIWGILVVCIALGYGAAYLWAVVRRRWDWDDLARVWNIRGAIALCAIALFLALPILDFGSISAKDQIARLNSGRTKLADFDWGAMAFDFGPKGRAILQTMATGADPKRAEMAKATLAAKSKWDVDNEQIATVAEKPLEQRLIVDGGGAVEPSLLSAIQQNGTCKKDICRVVQIDPNTVLVLRVKGQVDADAQSDEPKSDQSAKVVEIDAVRGSILRLRKDDKGVWESKYSTRELAQEADSWNGEATATTRVEIRTIQKKQVFIDGKPYDEPF